MSCSARRPSCKAQPEECQGNVHQTIALICWHSTEVRRRPLSPGRSWHALLPVYIKSHSARIEAMGALAGPQTLYKEVLKPLILQDFHHKCWRRPLLDQICHSTRRRVLDQSAVQCQAVSRRPLCPQSSGKHLSKEFQLRASAASSDGISAGANANLVPGGRDFFTCMSCFALF